MPFTKKEQARESDVDRVVVVLVAPVGNTDFRDNVTSPVLARRGDTVETIMRSLMRTPDRLVVTSAVELFGRFPASEHPDIAPAVQEIRDRYVAGR